ncbi:hypothetical protein ACFX2I_038367 [Malus domestica]
MEETGEDGFDQAIKLSAECLSNMKFIQEHNLLGKYFEEEQKNNEQLSRSCQSMRSRGSGGDLNVLVAILSLSPTNYTRSRNYVEHDMRSFVKGYHIVNSFYNCIFLL